jgi:hypothetical protein
LVQSAASRAAPIRIWREILRANRLTAQSDPGARLVGLGRYALRGVARPQELFTLDWGG